MARDSGESDRDDFGFVDRDDDRKDGLVDPDYDDSFPGEPGEAMEDAPDPGYAAYLQELEDPLEDWPSPDRPLDEIPEHRLAQERRERELRAGGDEPGKDEATGEAARDARAGNGAERGEPWGPDAAVDRQGSEDRFQTMDPTDAFPRETDAASPLAEFDEEPPSPAPPDRSDSDGSDFDDDWLSADQDDATPFAGAPTREEPPMHGRPVPPKPARDEDELVDDFLNDLDDMDDDPSYGSAMSDSRERAQAAPADYGDFPGNGRDAPESAAAQAGAAALAGAANIGRGKDIDRDPPIGSPRGQKEPDDESPSRLVPWVMVAVVLLALVLLGVGGYGVVKQRSELEGQIRDLQAQLATAVTTEEVAVERERQRRIELENEALAAELEGLQAENAALTEDISALEARLEEQEAEAAQEAQRAAEAVEAAAAARRAAAQREATETGSARSGTAGPWFVNFGSYAQRDIADRWASRLDVDDGEVVVQSAEAAGRTLFRVRVIGLASQDRAERVATTLERQYQLPRLWVGRN